MIEIYFAISESALHFARKNKKIKIKKKNLWNVNKYKNADNSKYKKSCKAVRTRKIGTGALNPDLKSHNKWAQLAPRHLARYSCTTK